MTRNISSLPLPPDPAERRSATAKFKLLVKTNIRRATSMLETRLAGIETAHRVRLEDLGVASPERLNYVASGWGTLRRILPPREVVEDDIFLDLGAGKGRVLLEAAARYPFKRVAGVELSEELADVARANIARLSGRLRCREILVVTADALEWDIPDDVSVIYLYNPFRGETFAEVVAKIVASADRNPRRLRLIYRSPFEEAILLATGRFKRIRSRPGAIPWSLGSTTRMYDLVP